VSDLLALRAGTELVFQRSAGEGFDVLVGNLRIGSGEVMELDGQLVLRLEEVDVHTGGPQEGARHE
jgi:flagellar motor switch/type III secretory pathway protein FliN